MRVAVVVDRFNLGDDLELPAETEEDLFEVHRFMMLGYRVYFKQGELHERES